MAIGMRMNKIISILIVSLALLGCNKEIDLKIENLTSISVSVYKDHQFIRKNNFGSGSKELDNLKAWLMNNKAGWDTYLATPAIGEVLVKGDGLTLNIGKDWAVVNYASAEGEYSQLIKSINFNEFKYLYDI